jgi:hypothetical protein
VVKEVVANKDAEEEVKCSKRSIGSDSDDAPLDSGMKAPAMPVPNPTNFESRVDAIDMHNGKVEHGEEPVQLISNRPEDNEVDLIIDEPHKEPEFPSNTQINNGTSDKGDDP